MKITLHNLLLCGFVLFGMSITSCDEKCEETREFIRYEPVFIDQAEYEKEVSLEAPREVEAPGVIVSYQNYLFINEFNQGVHVIDNNDPANPVNEAFIAINNNKHFSIKDGIMLANRYGDLVAIDISQPGKAEELQRIEQVFPDEAELTDQGIISHYTPSSEIVTMDCQQPWRGDVWLENDMLFVNLDASTNSFSMNNGITVTEARAFSSNGTTNVSVSSSSARFTITKNHLYVLNRNMLEVFDVLVASNPQRSLSTEISWDSETLFPLNDYLFIGGQTGMNIYDLSNPKSPTHLSTFQHAFSCDPVVANETHAYVTLRTGNPCQGNINEMDVINIEQIQTPDLISRHDLSNPRGLTLVGDHLFVCDNDKGVIVFDVADENNIKQVGSYSQNQANDVLPVSSDVVVVSGEDGIFELDISDVTNPQLLSFVTIK